MLGSAPEWKKLITFVLVSPRDLNFKAITFNDNESQTLALFALFSFVIDILISPLNLVAKPSIDIMGTTLVMHTFVSIAHLEGK